MRSDPCRFINDFPLGLHRTLRLNELTHFFLSALTAQSGGDVDAALLFLVNGRSNVLQGLLGVTRNASLLAISPEDGERSWTHPHLTAEVLRQQRDDPFNRAVVQLRFPLTAEVPLVTACREQRSLTVVEPHDSDDIFALLSEYFPINGYACIPLCGREQLMGAIVVARCQAPSMAALLAGAEPFARHAEVAIDNVMLLRRLEQANEDLREAEARAQQDEKMAMLGELVASIAHDLKTPLVSIGGYARRLDRLVEGETVHAYVETIIRESRRLEDILGGILSFSRKQMICYESCRPVEMLGELLRKDEVDLKRSGIRFVIDAADDLPEILADCVRLSQVFMNLIQNACQAMPRGGVLTVRLEPALLRGDQALSIEFEDSGKGIPEEILGSIFKPFFTTRAAGTGLGLAICLRIVEQHQGEIRAFNSPRGGAIFRVLIPAMRD